MKASAIIGTVTNPFYMLHGSKTLTGMELQKSRSQKTFKSLKDPTVEIQNSTPQKNQNIEVSHNLFT